MAEIAGGFLGPAIEVVKWVGAPILRQFNYLCCFTTNITNLKNEAQKLQDTERDLQGKVDAARNDVRLISCEVETWLRSSKEIKDEKDGIIDEVPNVEGGCLKLRARFSLSRRAKKTTDRLKELRDQCKFNDNSISLPGPPPATKAVPSESSYEFKSRKQIEEDIMTILRGEDAKMIGICGMGGLGKTTMAKRIMNRALEEHVFQEVAMAVVSQPIDKLKIQLEIGGSLGLNLEGETSEAAIKFLYESDLLSMFGEYLSNKKMRLKWEGATCLGDWIKVQLLRDTECLVLVGNGANEVGLTDLEKKIRYLELGECESMKKVVTSSMDKGDATVLMMVTTA